MSSRRWLDLPRLALAAIVVNVAIVLTGGIVRVTGSGLGCPDWPTCEGTRVVPSGSEAGWHQAIEFGNRLMTFLVLAVVVAVYVAARRQSDDPKVRRLAFLLPLGVLAQAVLGGITVLTGLHPLVVAAHFLLSMVLIAIATVLHVRLRSRQWTGPVTPAPKKPRGLAYSTVAVAALVLVLGTLVTAAGPHAGDPGTARLGLDIRDIARLHAGAVWVVVGLTVATYVAARRAEATELQRAAGVLLLIELVQGTVGYAQYALGIPAGLVALHILLASLFWVAAVRVGAFATRAAERRPTTTATAAPVGA